MNSFLESFFGMPVLRRVSETDQGPHRSATPESTHMQNIQLVHEPQDDLGFIREGFVSFTADQARLVLDRCRYSLQRDETKAKAHIDSLAEQMRRGLWLSKTQIDFARVGSQLILVNGHHRMHAQAASGIDIVWSVVIHECGSQDEVAQLYWKFDTTLRKRTRANIVNGIGLAGELGIGSQVAASLWSCAQTIALGMRFHVHMRDGAGILPDERLMVCRDYAREARFYQNAIKKAITPVRRKMMQASLMAVALVTLKHQPSKAQEFWVGFCEDDGLAKGDPRKTLLADIQTRHATAGLSSAQMMAAARAWSAFYHGRDLKIIKVTGCPVDIAGTPFTVQA